MVFSFIWLKASTIFSKSPFFRSLYENNQDVNILTNTDTTVWQITVGVRLDLIIDLKMFAWWHIYQDFNDKLKCPATLNCKKLPVWIHAVKNVEIETVLKIKVFQIPVI